MKRPLRLPHWFISYAKVSDRLTCVLAPSGHTCMCAHTHTHTHTLQTHAHTHTQTHPPNTHTHTETHTHTPHLSIPIVIHSLTHKHTHKHTHTHTHTRTHTNTHNHTHTSDLHTCLPPMSKPMTGLPVSWLYVVMA